jgi:hypothetical protein
MEVFGPIITQSLQVNFCVLLMTFIEIVSIHF